MCHKAFLVGTCFEEEKLNEGTSICNDVMELMMWLCLLKIGFDSMLRWECHLMFSRMYQGNRMFYYLERMTLDEECCVRFYLKMSGWLQSIHWRKVCWLKESLRK